MAGSSLLALIDDIATLLDDVSVMTKVAAKKTAGVLGDDLALNAQQVSGVRAERELPVVWAVARGSLRNKVILVPAALVISAVAPWAVTPLLMLGGAFLCFEGCEKLAHRWLHSPAEEAAHHAEHLAALAATPEALLAVERDKIAGAVRTDFILSAEIIVIALGTVATAPFVQRVSVLVGIAALMTVGVYGLVAAIVKLDDAGLALTQRASRVAQAAGRALLAAAPRLMRTLAVLGTAAMFSVGGSILVHGLPPVHHALAHLAEPLAALPAVGDTFAWLAPLLLEAAFGVAAGALLLASFAGLRRLRATAPAPG